MSKIGLSNAQLYSQRVEGDTLIVDIQCSVCQREKHVILPLEYKVKLANYLLTRLGWSVANKRKPICNLCNYRKQHAAESEGEK